jgi:hypothetical protein
MANENSTGRKQGSETPKATGAAQSTSQMLNTVPAPRKSSKGNRPAVGGTARPGAKSTQPKKFTEEADQQQQQLESYNRDMRRRMERMGYSDTEQRAKTAVNQRKKRAERLKERREQQLAHVKKSLPGGKVDTNPRNVYFMIAGVAIAVIVIIAIFAILRSTGHI